MRRRLSSAQTFFAKFIFPAGFFAAAAVMLTLFIALPLLADWPFTWAGALIALGWAGGVTWCCFTVYIPLKVVSLDGRCLRVSNFRKEIAIPLSEVKQVEEVKQFRFKLVSLSLKRPNEFGREIKFMPRARLRLWKEHPVVGELRGLIESPGD
jgi:hypothetical protein